MNGAVVDDAGWMVHLRLSILDLSEAGRQPMATKDGRFVMVYNGEVYNFEEIATSLHLNDLRSHSDTEVVLRAFEARGTAAIPLLNGIFAFAVHDRQAQKAWLVRDRLGVKPLHYRCDGTGLSFASELGALEAMSPVPFDCDVASVNEWLHYGNSLGEHTLLSGVRRLLPGHWLEIDLRTFETRTHCYWSPAHYVGRAKLKLPVEQRVLETRRLLEQAVERQLVSDVPVGVFLSGGVDSSAIAAFASKHYDGRIATYSVGFDFDRGPNELPVAGETAKRLGTDHHEIHVSGVDVADVVVKMVEHHGMPFSDAANIPLYLLSEKVRDSTKVVLQGDGGDELFGGYRRHATLSYYPLARALARGFGWAASFGPLGARYHRQRRYANALCAGDIAEVMAALLTEEDRSDAPESVFGEAFRSLVVQSDPFRRYRECQALVAQEPVVDQMLFVDTMIILPDIFLEKVDRASMAASIEVRVPFLDNDLVDFCLRLPGRQKMPFGQKKWLLRKALEGVVPEHVLRGRKIGFSVPYGEWLRNALRPLFFDELSSFETRHPDVIDLRRVHQLHREHVSRTRDRSFLLWKILNFAIWANRVPVRFP